VKIALVSLARRGGMVHFLVEMATALRKLGEITAVVSTEQGPIRLPRKLNRIRLDTGANRPSSILHAMNPFAWLRFGAQMAALAPDIVHLVGVHEWNPLLALCCKLLGLPLVYTVHDPESHPGAPSLIRASDRLTIRMADRLITMTQAGRRTLVEGGIPATRIQVIPHPLYTVFRDLPTGRLPGWPTILFFGRLERYKGIEILFGAFRSICAALPKWRLIVAGNGPLTHGLTENPGERIEVLNRYIPDREVAQLMRAASFVVVPYTAATQSGVIALAYAFERPVVASAVGGIPEMVSHGRTGMLVRPGDAGALARALRLMASNPGLRRRMQGEIRRRNRGSIAPASVAGAHMRLYASLVAQRGAR